MFLYWKKIMKKNALKNLKIELEEKLAVIPENPTITRNLIHKYMYWTMGPLFNFLAPFSL